MWLLLHLGPDSISTGMESRNYPMDMNVSMNMDMEVLRIAEDEQTTLAREK